MRRIRLALLLVSTLSLSGTTLSGTASVWADASAPSAPSTTAPPSQPAYRASKLCRRASTFFACGTLGPPCCLGDHLLMPSARTDSLEAVVAALARVAAEDLDEGRIELMTIRATVPKNKAGKLEALMRREPRLSKLVTAAEVR